MISDLLGALVNLSTAERVDGFYSSWSVGQEVTSVGGSHRQNALSLSLGMSSRVGSVAIACLP